MPQTSLLNFFATPTDVPDGSVDTSNSRRGAVFRNPPVQKQGARQGLTGDERVESFVTSTENEKPRTILSALQNVADEKEKPREDITKLVSDNLDTQSSPTPTITLPHNPSITITRIQASHFPALKRLTSSLLPIKYPDNFYQLAIPDRLSFVVLYQPHPTNSAFSTIPSDAIPIGWIRCSFDPYPSPIYPNNQLYIKTLCLLAPYRHLGVATALLDAVLAQKEIMRKLHAGIVFAHVWEANEEALEWYEKRGFVRDLEIGLVEGYYRRLKPEGAWVVWKEIS